MKVIWIYWNTGIDNAPRLVKECVNSWIEKNPDWDVKLLDDESLYHYLTIDHIPNLSTAHFSDLLRLELLCKYGGLWVDATTYCINPLSDWLPVGNGLFFFKSEEWRYGLSNWFIYSKPNNPILMELLSYLNSYWTDELLNENAVKKIIKRILTSLTYRYEISRKIWFNFIIKDVFKIYPYFVFHFKMGNIFESTTEFKKAWDDIPFISNEPPHLAQRYGFNSERYNEFETEINMKKINVLKLTYRHEELLEGRLINRLLNKG